MSIGWIVEAQELPPLNINAMAQVSMQYILKSGQLPALTRHSIDTKICTVLSDMHLEHCFLAPCMTLSTQYIFKKVMFKNTAAHACWVSIYTAEINDEVIQIMLTLIMFTILIKPILNLKCKRYPPGAA